MYILSVNKYLNFSKFRLLSNGSVCALYLLSNYADRSFFSFGSLPRQKLKGKIPYRRCGRSRELERNRKTYKVRKFFNRLCAECHKIFRKMIFDYYENQYAWVFDADLHDVRWHSATHESLWPWVLISTDRGNIDVNETIPNGFVFSSYTNKADRTTYPLQAVSRVGYLFYRRSPSQLTLLVHSLRSAQWDIVWLVQTVTHFDLFS